MYVEFVVQSSVVIGPAIFCWVVVSVRLQLRGQYQPTLARHAVTSAFVVYLLALVHVTVFPIHVHIGEAKQSAHFREAINLVPFNDLRPRDFFLNIAMTVPLGLFMPVVFRRIFTCGGIASIAFLAGTTFELNQFLLRVAVANDRFVDVNDVMANAAGVLVGYAIFRLGLQHPMFRSWFVSTLLA